MTKSVRLVLLGACLASFAFGACSEDSSPTAPTAPPQLSSVSPATGAQGTTLSVTVTGTNFTSGATTTLSLSGSGITVSDVVIQNATTATARIAIAPDAPLGPRTLVMGNGSSSITFTVTAGAPTLSGLAPSGAVAGTSVLATLTGTGFTSGATVAVAGTGVSVSEVTVVGPTTINARFAVDAGAEFGARDVTVTTTAGTSGAQPFAVGAPNPSLTSIAPSSGRPGTTVRVIVSGVALVPGATTLAISGSGVTIADVSTAFAAATARSLTASLVIAADASPGPRTVTITTPGGSSSLPFTVTAPAPTIGSFTANPLIIIQGTSATLSWTGVTNATVCSINVGVGVVPCSNSSVVVTPSATTEYQLMTTGPGGREWMYATVNVEPPRGPVAAGPSGSQTFNFTGAAQTFVVPAGVTQITVEASGAQGGSGFSAGGTPGSGGLGGSVRATLTVVPGASYQINIGGQGGAGDAGQDGGGGGGATDLRTGGTTLNDRVLVAGGGGGGGGAQVGGTGGAGGAGGGLTGGTGGNSGFSIGGDGGTQVAGGAGGASFINVGLTGALGIGGAACCNTLGGAGGTNGGAVGNTFSGGGGGGLFGGGGGSVDGANGSGGGGGSSFATGTATNVTHQQGVRSGNGQVVITW